MNLLKPVHAVVFALVAMFGTSAALGQEFPLTIEHAFGTTTLEQKPERVITLDYSGIDDLLAFGVKPVAVRYWYGDYDYGAWPWAQKALGEAKPDLLKGEINIEQIAALKPDVILAIAAGITKEQYLMLSQIAPTIGPAKGYSTYGTPWQVRARLAGKAVGEAKKADELVSAIETRMANIAKAHPAWDGMTAAVAYMYDGAPGAYHSNDVRPQLLSELGFVTPEAIDSVGDPDAFWMTLSPEDISPLDTDLLIWMVDGGALEDVKNMALRKTLNAYKQGREVLSPPLLSAALSYASTLSLNYALDELVPLIELAVDGDPQTVVPTSKEAGLLD